MIYYVLSRRMQLLKVGYTENLEQRLRAIRVLVPDAELLAAERGGRDREAWMHHFYSTVGLHFSGEWFHVNEWLLSTIEVANGYELGICSACGLDYAHAVREDGLCEGCVPLPALRI